MTTSPPAWLNLEELLTPEETAEMQAALEEFHTASGSLRAAVVRAFRALTPLERACDVDPAPLETLREVLLVCTPAGALNDALLRLQAELGWLSDYYGPPPAWLFEEVARRKEMGLYDSELIAKHAEP